jgi:signal transduction histidine kinase
MAAAATIPTAVGFRRLIISALIVPVGLMIVIAAVLAIQIKGLLDASAMVERSNLVLARINRLEKLTVDLETGLRGFLLTGDDAFLEPFRAGRGPTISEARELKQVLAADAEQVALLQEIGRLRDAWLAFADRAIASRRAGDEVYMRDVRAHRGKMLMDQIRARYARFIANQERLRDARSHDARVATRNTLLGVGVMTLLGGAVLAWLARRQFMELARSYERALDEAQQLNANLERRVTERTQLLEERSAQLTEANRELEAFAYSISHDLRAPMRHISGFAALLAKSAGPDLSADDRETLTTIHDTARNAGRMVDDLLAFSRIGRTAMRRDTLDMDALLQQVLRDLAPETRGRAIDWDLAPLPPAHGDAALLRMVLQNLIGNAVKYTGKRERAHIRVGATSGADGRPVYFVADNGTGFEMKYADKLFGVFQRLHRAEEFEGTGIGLANVRRIIERHGGRVWADSTIGQGATFSFTIPQPDAAAAAAAAVPTSPNAEVPR